MPPIPGVSPPASTLAPLLVFVQLTPEDPIALNSSAKIAYEYHNDLKRSRDWCR
jgi:hypothetical protein